MQRFLEYNSKQKALKASQAQAEIESDRRHQLEYLAKLEQQEKDRERALKKTYERSARAAKVCSMPVPSPEQMQAPPGRGAAQLSDKLADAEAKRIRRLREDKEKVQDVLVQQMKRKKDMMHEERAAEMKVSTGVPCLHFVLRPGPAAGACRSVWRGLCTFCFCNPGENR